MDFSTENTILDTKNLFSIRANTNTFEHTITWNSTANTRIYACDVQNWWESWIEEFNHNAESDNITFQIRCTSSQQLQAFKSNIHIFYHKRFFFPRYLYIWILRILSQKVKVQIQQKSTSVRPFHVDYKSY